MSGSESRIRNYRMSARLDAKEKQKLHDLVMHMGFKSEGDFLRVLVLGSPPESRPSVDPEFVFGRELRLELAVNGDEGLRRRSDLI